MNQNERLVSKFEIQPPNGERFIFDVNEVIFNPELDFDAKTSRLEELSTERLSSDSRRELEIASILTAATNTLSQLESASDRQVYQDLVAGLTVRRAAKSDTHSLKTLSRIADKGKRVFTGSAQELAAGVVAEIEALESLSSQQPSRAQAVAKAAAGWAGNAFDHHRYKLAPVLTAGAVGVGGFAAPAAADEPPAEPIPPAAREVDMASALPDGANEMITINFSDLVAPEVNTPAEPEVNEDDVETSQEASDDFKQKITINSLIGIPDRPIDEVEEVIEQPQKEVVGLEAVLSSEPIEVTEAPKENAEKTNWNPEAMPDGEAIKKGLMSKYDNVSGKLSDNELTVVNEKLFGAHRLHPEAAAGILALNGAFKAEFGRDIEFTDSYRSYDEQVEAKAAKPSLTATPGKSVHGFGLAVDFAANINNFRSKEHQWMMENAHKFGFIHPVWAREFKEPNAKVHKPEAWHFEWEGRQALNVDYSYQMSMLEKEQAANEKTNNRELSVRELDLKAAEVMSKKDGETGRAGQVMAIMLRETSLTPGQISGILGNLKAESGIISDRKQMPRVPGGPHGPGRGLAQWEVGDRFDTNKTANLVAFAKKRGTDWTDLETQVLFLIHELEVHSYLGYSDIKKATKVSEASSAFLTKFERPAVQGAHVHKKRADFGNEFYAEFDKIRSGLKSSTAEAKPAKTPEKKVEASPAKFEIHDKKLEGAERVVQRAYYYAEHPGTITQMCGTTNCSGMCARATGVLWGKERSGYETAGHMRRANKVDPSANNVPVGALLYFRGYSAAEHVAIKVAPGKVATNMTHKNTYEIITFEEANRMFKYLGWSKPNFRAGNASKDPVPKDYISDRMIKDNAPKDNPKADKEAPKPEPKVDKKPAELKKTSAPAEPKVTSEPEPEKPKQSAVISLSELLGEPDKTEDAKEADDTRLSTRQDSDDSEVSLKIERDSTSQEDKIQDVVDEVMREVEIDAEIDRILNTSTGSQEFSF